MSVFTKYDTELCIQYHKQASELLKRDLWMVTKAFNYHVGDEQSSTIITIPAGYLTDGASVPRVFWSLIPPWGNYGQAAVLHDWLCENGYVMVNGIIDNIDRKQADDIFLEAMGVLKVPKYKSIIMYYAIRAFCYLTKTTKTKGDPTKQLVEYYVRDNIKQGKDPNLTETQIEDIKKVVKKVSKYHLLS